MEGSIGPPVLVLGMDLVLGMVLGMVESAGVLSMVGLIDALGMGVVLGMVESTGVQPDAPAVQRSSFGLLFKNLLRHC